MARNMNTSIWLSTLGFGCDFWTNDNQTHPVGKQNDFVMRFAHHESQWPSCNIWLYWTSFLPMIGSTWLIRRSSPHDNRTLESSSNSSWLLVGSWLFCKLTKPFMFGKILVHVWRSCGGLNKEHSISVHWGSNYFGKLNRLYCTLATCYPIM